MAKDNGKKKNEGLWIPDDKLLECHPILVDAKTASKLCGMGLSLWYELSSTGRTPQPVKLNSKKLWSYELLRLWGLNGCPSRDSTAWQKLLEGGAINETELFYRSGQDDYRAFDGEKYCRKKGMESEKRGFWSIEGIAVMESTEKTTKKRMPGPEIHLICFTTPEIFLQVDVSVMARLILSVVSNFRTHGGNLYKLCSNQALERMFSMSHSQFMRAKRELRDAGLIDYDGNIGDLTPLIEQWEKRTGKVWEYEL